MALVQSKSIVILGASGNLALTKLLPSLFTLHSNGVMPREFNIFGYARSEMSSESFREIVRENLKENICPTEFQPRLVNEFLDHIHYVAGQYASTEDFIRLDKEVKEKSQDFIGEMSTLYYLSIPPSVFTPVIHSLHESGAVEKGPKSKQTVIVEKPFGYDTESAEELNEVLSETFDEEQIYRIDHYLGKEAIQNLMVLRFANIIFEPVWNRNYIKSVTVSWEEDKKIGDRGGYFDQAGIIRDVIQNHLLQILALVAMEKPQSLAAKDVEIEKNKAVKSIETVTLDDVVLGQYTDGVCSGKPVIGYTKEKSVPTDSKRETFAKIKCHVNNERWSGIPFYLTAGKAMTKSSTEVVIEFKDVPGDIYIKNSPHNPNKLTIRVQPDAGVVFSITNKVPGRGMVLKDVNMDFSYHDDFHTNLPGAYERLLLDGINGDKTLFISYEELIHSWKIFTPILKTIDKGEAEVFPYPAGTHGPEEIENLEV